MWRKSPRRFVYVSKRLADEILLANPLPSLPLLKKVELPIIGGGGELDWTTSKPQITAKAIRRSTKASNAATLTRSQKSNFVRDVVWLRWGELQVLSPTRHVAWLSGFDSEENPKMFIALCGSLENFRDWNKGQRQENRGWYPSSAFGMNDVLGGWEQDDPALARQVAQSESREEWGHTASVIHNTLGSSYWVDSGKVDALFECYFRTSDVRYMDLPESVTEAIFGAPVWVAK